MIFQGYEKTGVIYHIVSLVDLRKTLKNGIVYDDKITYKSKYDEFHKLIDEQKPGWVPDWVVRGQSIFASMNYPKEHKFHSHSAILAIKINPEKCWVANENRANQIYEPFILQHIETFKKCTGYLDTKGKESLKEYWETSLSFKDYIKTPGKMDGYDVEVLVNHSIKAEDIEIKYIISDHRMMNVEEWKKVFCFEL